MKSQTFILLFLVPLSLSATSPPREIPFEAKVCLATHIFVGTASDFAVVADPSCEWRGDGKHLTMCEEVQVAVSVSETVVPANWHPTDKLTFRFGGGLFSADNLRKDLLDKPRYFFTTVSLDGAQPVYRTSYSWFLGAEFTPENEKLVNEALGKCSAPNNSFKPKPFRGSA